MTKVNINGHDHQVEIEADGELATVVEQARALWEATKGSDAPPGPATGFVIEKAPQWDHDRRPPVR